MYLVFCIWGPQNENGPGFRFYQAVYLNSFSVGEIAKHQWCAVGYFNSTLSPINNYETNSMQSKLNKYNEKLPKLLITIVSL